MNAGLVTGHQGCGPIGLLTLQCARAAGAGRLDAALHDLPATIERLADDPSSALEVLVDPRA